LTLRFFHLHVLYKRLILSQVNSVKVRVFSPEKAR